MSLHLNTLHAIDIVVTPRSFSTGNLSAGNTMNLHLNTLHAIDAVVTQGGGPCATITNRPETGFCPHADIDHHPVDLRQRRCCPNLV